MQAPAACCCRAAAWQPSMRRQRGWGVPGRLVASRASKSATLMARRHAWAPASGKVSYCKQATESNISVSETRSTRGVSQPETQLSRQPDKKSLSRDGRHGLTIHSERSQDPWQGGGHAAQLMDAECFLPQMQRMVDFRLFPSKAGHLCVLLQRCSIFGCTSAASPSMIHATASVWSLPQQQA